ncbi:MAG: formylglycine-generating enzyme family protein [Kiritimatiellae bacterium]|nr:formylglycine-generating enzyme family protein [Kiritimatiellia bacterium]
MKAKLSIMGLSVAALALTACAADATASAQGAAGRKTGDVKTITLPGGATMEMIWCEPGTFKMGSPPTETGRFEDEAQHVVKITRGFWLGKYEVTQRQWESVMHSNLSRFKGPDHPIENISWHDCMTFVRRVRSEAKIPVRLPTEAEWEYACRAGSESAVSGNGKLPDMAWYDDNSECQTHEVGTHTPNAWGFFDMHGNVLEWCADWFSVLTGDAVDPKGPPSGSFKMLRGGCWFFYDRDCRSAYRLKRDPTLRNCIFGFRLACTDIPEQKTKPAQ